MANEWFSVNLRKTNTQFVITIHSRRYCNKIRDVSDTMLMLLLTTRAVGCHRRRHATSLHVTIALVLEKRRGKPSVWRCWRLSRWKVCLYTNGRSAGAGWMESRGIVFIFCVCWNGDSQLLFWQNFPTFPVAIVWANGWIVIDSWVGLNCTVHNCLFELAKSWRGASWV